MSSPPPKIKPLMQSSFSARRPSPSIYKTATFWGQPRAIPGSYGGQGHLTATLAASSNGRPLPSGPFRLSDRHRGPRVPGCRTAQAASLCRRRIGGEDCWCINLAKANAPISSWIYRSSTSLMPAHFVSANVEQLQYSRPACFPVLARRSTMSLPQRGH